MLILPPDMKEICMHGRLKKKKKENDKAEAISADSEASVTVMHL